MLAIEDIKTQYGNEMALLLLCCRLHCNREAHETLRSFVDSNAIDWDHLRFICGYHRVKPIVYKILGTVDIPLSIARQIKQELLYLIQQNLRQGLEAERIISLLKEQGLWCIPYKGISFARQFYGDIVSRESTDIDFVIHHPDFEKVLELMRKSGYSFENQLEYDYFKKDIYKREKSLDFNKYQNGSRAFHVEFHWRISPNTVKVKTETHALLFKTGSNALLVRDTVEMLNRNAHYLAILTHHAMNDGFSVLRNILDISQIVQKTEREADLGYITDAISDFRLGRAAKVCNFLCEELLGVALPFSEKSTGAMSVAVRKHFIEQLLHKKMIGDHFKIKPFNKNVFYLKDNTADKITYIAACLKQRFTPSPKDIRIFNLPKPLFFLYALLKPFRSFFSRVSDKEKKMMAQNLE